MRVLTEELRLKAGVLRKFGQAYFGEEGAENDATPAWCSGFDTARRDGER